MPTQIFARLRSKLHWAAVFCESRCVARYGAAIFIRNHPQPMWKAAQQSDEFRVSTSTVTETWYAAAAAARHQSLDVQESCIRLQTDLCRRQRLCFHFPQVDSRENSRGRWFLQGESAGVFHQLLISFDFLTLGQVASWLVYNVISSLRGFRNSV